MLLTITTLVRTVMNRGKREVTTNRVPPSYVVALNEASILIEDLISIVEQQPYLLRSEEKTLEEAYEKLEKYEEMIEEA